MLIFEGLLVLILVSYLFGLKKMISTWQEIPSISKKACHKNDKLSLIIALRNEESNIYNLKNSIESQNIDRNQLEIILVDDYSTDNTFFLLSTWAKESKFEIKVEKNHHNQGKKFALTSGIEKSSNEILVFTDADCSFSENWLSSYYHFFNSSEALLAFGSVIIEDNDEKIFSQLQKIEFASLGVAAAASWQLGIPNMCNGANIAYHKNLFYELNGFESHIALASGDDEFMMQAAFKKYPNQVFYVKNEDFLIKTRPIGNVKKFFFQRLRWASKWEKYQDWKVQLTAFYIFSFNLSHICMFFVMPLFFAIGFSILRWLLEFFLIGKFLKDFNEGINFKSFLMLVLIYPFYVVFFGFSARIFKPKRW